MAAATSWPHDGRGPPTRPDRAVCPEADRTISARDRAPQRLQRRPPALGPSRSRLSRTTQPRKKDDDVTADRRTGPRLRGRDDAGEGPVPRLDRRLVGGAVLPPAQLHPRLHHRARLPRKDQTGVRPARREDHRTVRGPRREPREVGERYRRDPG